MGPHSLSGSCFHGPIIGSRVDEGTTVAITLTVIASSAVSRNAVSANGAVGGVPILPSLADRLPGLQI